MNKFCKELIESLTEACDHAEGKPRAVRVSNRRSARGACHPPGTANVGSTNSPKPTASRSQP
jgi:hypothetical protein